MTKEEVLQRANTYCSERSYDSETLTDDFKDKFAEFFVKKHEAAGIDDDGILDEIKFILDTARSAATRGLAAKQKAFESKESDYKNQIAELNKKIANPQQQQQQQQQQQLELPDDIKNQLAELQKFKDEEAKKNKFNEIVALAKKDIREDCISDFDIFVRDYEVKGDVAVEEQAKRLHSRFQEIFKSKIGDIKPLAPKQVQKQEDEFIDSIPKVKVQ